MEAKMRKGKIIKGKLAETFVRIGIAEPVRAEVSKPIKPKVVEQKKVKPKTKGSAPKRRGRPAKKKK